MRNFFARLIHAPQCLLWFCCISWVIACRDFNSSAQTSSGRRMATETGAHPLSVAALRLTEQSVTYDPAYVRIPYPGGDVPANRGVCADVVIRAYRLGLNIDLQKEIHEDMSAHFSRYPQKWGLSKPDPNIDHRRVPNLMTFFERKGVSKSMSPNPEAYQPGDVVAWRLGNGLLHIGVVTHKRNERGVPLVVHNIGGGQVLADCLFSWEMIGHYDAWED